MSFPTHPQYQDSGRQWLGQLPTGWRLVPFWSLFRRVKRTEFPEEELLSVYRDYGVIRKRDRDDNFNKASEDLGPYQLVEPGDLAVNKMKAWQGSLGVSPYRGIVSPAYFVYRALHNELPRYLHYLLRSDPYATGFLTISKGIRINQWDVDPDHLAQLPIPLPAPPEQAAIVAFLDRETAKIDTLVEEQRRLIELLKEKRQAVISHAVTKGLDQTAPTKDSGVDWLGEVPAHWSVAPLRYVARVQTGIAKGKDLEGRIARTVPYLRVANVQDGHIDLTDVAEIEIAEHDLSRYLLRRGDVLMNEGGDFDKLGRGDIWQGQIDPCVHQNHVFAVRPTGVSAEWLNLITSSSYAQQYFMTRSKQSTNLASISSRNVMNLPVVLPPPSEQASLAARVGEIVLTLAEMRETAEGAVKLLQERRAALISAAVTGKIDVRDAAIQRAEAA